MEREYHTGYIQFANGVAIFNDSRNKTIATYDPNPEVEGSLQHVHDRIGLALDSGTLTRGRHAYLLSKVREIAEKTGERIKLARPERDELNVHALMLNKLKRSA